MTMAARFLLDTKPMSSSADLISRFSESAMASPFRSTVPLLALTKDAWTAFERLLGLCNMVGDLSVAFERRIPSPKGEGRPSHTDAMVLSDHRALAIEAKWTEPRYETVAARLSRKAANGRDSKEFVEGWLELLQRHAAKRLRLDDVSGCVYQMVHRAASACGLDRAPSLAYLHFVPATKGAATSAQYLNDLSQLHALLGSPADFPFFLIELPTQRTRAFQAIEHLKKGEAETGRVVRSALLETALFTFGEPSVRRIGAARG